MSDGGVGGGGGTLILGDQRAFAWYAGITFSQLAKQGLAGLRKLMGRHCHHHPTFYSTFDWLRATVDYNSLFSARMLGTMLATLVILEPTYC
jgi:hypothetical protein